MSEANEVDEEDMDCWINNIDKAARIKKNSAIVKRRFKTIHFAHCVRSVAAIRPSVVPYFPPDCSRTIRVKYEGGYYFFTVVTYG